MRMVTATTSATLAQYLSRLTMLLQRHRDAATAFFIRVLSAFLVLALQVFLARQMPLEGYGTFVTITTWIIVTAGFAVMGFGESALRFLPRYAVRQQWRRMLQFFHTGLMVPVCAVSVTGALTVLFVMQLPLDATTRTIVILVAAGLPFAVADFFLEGAGRGMGWYKLAIVPTYIIQPVLIGIIVAVMACSGRSVDAVSASLALIAVSATLTLGRTVIMSRRFRRIVRTRTGLNASCRSGWRHASGWHWLWLRASLPLMAIYGMDDFLLYSDVLLLGVLGTPEDVAVYIAAVRALAIANFIHYAFMLVSARDFSLANVVRDKVLLQEHVYETSRMTFLLTVPAVLATLAFGYPLLLMFGEQFVVSYSVMMILGVGFILRSTVGQTFDLLAVTGHARAVVWLSIGCLAGNISLSVVLIPVYGINGAAMATAIVMGVRATGLALVARRLTGLSVLAFGQRTLSRPGT